MSVASTLHGYQVQYLYTLYRMLRSPESKEDFLPEGREDLDIYLDGQIVETVQVKCYSGTILYSDLFSKAKSTSLFSRGKASLEENPNVKISFVAVGYGNSKGVISNKLLKLSSLTKFLNKEEVLHLDYSSSKELASKINWLAQSETELNDVVEAALKERFPSIDPFIAKDYLLQWVHYLVINGQSATYDDLCKQVGLIIEFSVRQKEFFSQFGLTVIPLFHSDCQDNESSRMSYYQGVSAKEIHIANNYDVIREEKLQQLDEKLKNNNLVFITGISGSGKSSLAYRYLKICGTPLRYEVKYINQNNISQIIATIKDLSKGLKSTAFVYLDVQPYDTSWIQVVNEIEDVANVKCLVTIRQDDWNRCFNLVNANLHYSTLALDLTESEAKDIFDHLCDRGLCHIDIFEEAWNESGHPQTLLEYVYFLTQGVPLRARISEQIGRLDHVNASFLQYISVSNVLQGNISVNAIRNLCHLSPMDLSRCIDQMKGEFFEYNGEGFSDVHPIRTHIIIEEIFRNYRNGLGEIGMELFEHINENTSPLFLMALIDEGKYTPDSLLRELEGKKINSMQAYIVARTLVWCGVKHYIDNNQAAFDWLRQTAPLCWQYLVPVNFTEIELDESVDKLFGSQIGLTMDDVRKRFSLQTEVYFYLCKWLDSSISLEKPKKWRDYFWLAKFLTICNLQLSYKPEFADFKMDAKVPNNLEEMADVLLGLKLAGYDSATFYQLEENFIKQFRIQNNILEFDICENEVKCLTFLDYFSAGKQFENGDGDIMHRINLHHIDLLRKAFPNVDVYHSEIIKDDIFEDIDLTFEKHISREKLPLDEMQEPRTMMVHLYEKSYVLPSRKAYCDQLITLRKLFVDVIKEYWQGIDDIHRVGKAYNAKMDQVSYDVCDKILNTHIELPATEINRFGLGYVINKEENEGQSAKDNLKELNSLYSHYSTDLTIFFRQCYLPSGGFINDVQRMTIILLDAQDKLKKLQSLFHQVFDGYVDVVEIKQLDEREKQQMTCLIAVYNWLAQNQPYMSCRQLLKQIKPKKLTATQRFEVNDEVVDNPSQALVDTIEDLEKLRNMQLKDIYNRCFHLDDLSKQIVDKYIKRYDDTIENMRNCSL